MGFLATCKKKQRAASIQDENKLEASNVLYFLEAFLIIYNKIQVITTSTVYSQPIGGANNIIKPINVSYK